MPKKPRTAKPQIPELSGFVGRLRTLVSATTQARFASEAGVSPAWLSEILSGGSEPSMSTLIALAKAGRVSVEWLATGRAISVGASLGGGISYGDAGLVSLPEGHFAEAEAQPYEATGRRDIDDAVAAFLVDRVADVWRLKTVALDLAGYLPGDIVVVGAGVQPRSRDVVVAQADVRRREGAQAIWRIFAPPVLVPASSDRSILPTPLDEVVVMGVVLASFRPRA
jgi:transcriptional regulator with XRE-family HTH domain